MCISVCNLYVCVSFVPHRIGSLYTTTNNTVKFQKHISSNMTVCIPYHRPRGLQRLVRELTGRVPRLYLWCAGVHHRDIPSELKTEVLTTPLRSATAVLREVKPGVDRWSGLVYGYSDSGLPTPGDGPSVVRLSHHGSAHTGRWPLDCVQCGHDVAAELRRLGVGPRGEWIRRRGQLAGYRFSFLCISYCCHYFSLEMGFSQQY